jgi:hypothetical protein
MLGLRPQGLRETCANTGRIAHANDTAGLNENINR